MHICGDEIAAFLAALPLVGYCLKCLKLKFRRKTPKAVS